MRSTGIHWVRCLGATLACLLGAPGWVLPARAAERDLDFNVRDLHHIPPGYRSTVTGEGQPGDWQVVMADVPSPLQSIAPEARNVDQIPAVAQLAQDKTDEHFPLLILEDQTFRDFTFKTKFKIVSGIKEQMAGLAFRIQDAKDYYVVRASALGNTFRFYKFVHGERSPPIGVNLSIDKNVWHDLAVQCQGNQIRCFLDGKQAIPTLTDYSFLEGKLGFWTKSDSVVEFTRAHVSYRPQVDLAHKLVEDILKEYPRLLGLTLFGTSPDNPALRVLASSDSKKVGQPGGEIEHQVIAKNAPFSGRTRREVVVTLPLHDRNGDPVAAVQVRLRRFPGELERTSLARALPIVQEMQKQVLDSRDLTE